MPEPIIINELKGILKFFAKSCDVNNDGKLVQDKEFDEISLFNEKCEGFRKERLASLSIFQNDLSVPSDNTRVERPRIEDELILNSIKQRKNDAAVEKKRICQKMQDKWCNVFKKSPLQEEFFLKLYDVIKVLHVNVDNWDVENYASPEEQVMDEMIAVFAGEAQLNPKIIGYVKNEPTFYGLFQLSKEGLGAAKQWAKAHPDVVGMSNIDQNMTLQKFQKLKGEEQLDYLIAYIGSSREASKISTDEELSPAKLWSMVKLPNLDETNPKRLARREKTIVEKQDSIARIFKRNRIPKGID